jgi:hypothetical protein
VDRAARKRFLLANTTVLVVLAAMAATAILALRTTTDQVEQARQIDHRLARVDQLRRETRELGLSARRYILSGDQKEQQRVLAIVQDMRRVRESLAARSTLHNGAVFEADLEEFIAAMMNAMSIEDVDPIGRLSKFEDELVRIRAPMSATFDDVVAKERARRESLRSASSVAHIAQIGVGIAAGIAALLILGFVIPAARKGSGQAMAREDVPPTEPSVLR